MLSVAFLSSKCIGTSMVLDNISQSSVYGHVFSLFEVLYMSLYVRVSTEILIWSKCGGIRA